MYVVKILTLFLIFLFNAQDEKQLQEFLYRKVLKKNGRKFLLFAALFQLMQYAKYHSKNIENETSETIKYQPITQALNDYQSLQYKNHNILDAQVQISIYQNPQDQNILYQRILSKSNNEFPQNQQDQNFELPQITNLIRDADFRVQKGYLIMVLLLFILWSIIYWIILILLFGIFTLTKNQTNYFYPFLVTFFAIIMFFVSNLNYQKSNRKGIYIFTFLIISLQTLVFFPLIDMAADSRRHQFSISLLIVIGVCIFQISHLICTVVMLFYLIIEQKKIMIGKILILHIIIVIIILTIFCDFLIYLLMIIPFLTPYIFLLTNSIQQITRGRYKLEKNEVLVGTLVANFSLYVCCGQEEQK